MTTYRVTDPSSGKILRLTGDSPPTEKEIMQALESVGGTVQKQTVQKQEEITTKSETGPEWSGANIGGFPVGPIAYGALGAGKEIFRLGAETAGLVGGAIAGAPGGPIGAVAGAGLGYATVKGAERMFEEPDRSFAQGVKDTAQDVATGGMMEIGGQLVGGAVRGVRGWLAKPTTSTVPQNVIDERLSLAASQGIELTPAEATGSKGLALYESMLDKSPFSTSIINTMRELKQLKPLIALRENLLGSGGRSEQVEVIGQKIKDQVNSFLSQYKSMNEAQLNKIRDNILTKLGSSESFENLGKKAQEAIAERSKAVYGKAGELYSKVGEAIPEGTKVEIENLKGTATRLFEEESLKPPSLRNANVQKVLRDLSGSEDALMEEISQYPKAAQAQILAKMKAEGVTGYDWKTIQSIRSELNSRIAQSDAAMKTAQPGAKFQSSPEAGIYKQLRKSIDKDIETFAEQQGGDIKESFDLANAFYKERKLVYNSPTIRRIINSNPEKVVDMVFRPKGGAEIDAVRSAIGIDSFNRTVKPAITKRLLGEGVFNPKELASKLKNYGDEILTKVFNPQEVKMIKDLATDGKISMQETLAGHPFLKTIANERPEVVVDSILGSYERFPGSKAVLRNIALIRSSVPRETFSLLQREMSDRIFRLNQITEQVQPEKLAKTIQTYDRVLKLLYSPDQIQWLRDIAQTGRLMAAAEKQAANPSGTAQNVVTWGTWGAIINNPIKGMFSGIIAPKYMAKIYLSPMGRRYFMNGMQVPVNSGKGAELAMKIAEISGLDLATDRE